MCFCNGYVNKLGHHVHVFPFTISVQIHFQLESFPLLFALDTGTHSRDEILRHRPNSQTLNVKRNTRKMFWCNHCRRFDHTVGRKLFPVWCNDHVILPAVCSVVITLLHHQSQADRLPNWWGSHINFNNVNNLSYINHIAMVACIVHTCSNNQFIYKFC